MSLLAGQPRGRLGTTHLHPELQTAMIQGHGVQVFVQPVVQCPCLTADRQFDPLCPTCHGTGRFYPSGFAYATTLLLTYEASARRYEEAGTWIPGTIHASVLPGLRLAERDKVVVVDFRDTINDEVLIRGVDDTLRFAYGVSLTLVADRDTIYQAGRDYVLTPPNHVTWVPGGLAPPFLGQYACRYDCQVSYLVVTDSPRLRYEHRQGQSQEVLLMRLDHVAEGL
jgi:hypothetical protein